MLVDVRLSWILGVECVARLPCAVTASHNGLGSHLHALATAALRRGDGDDNVQCPVHACRAARSSLHGQTRGWEPNTGFVGREKDDHV